MERINFQAIENKWQSDENFLKTTNVNGKNFIV